MSGITNVSASPSPLIPRHHVAGQKPKTDTEAVAVARQAMNQAQGRVDADHRAHSPDCVAVDQKGVDKASAELTQIQASENAASASSQTLSITV